MKKGKLLFSFDPLMFKADKWRTVDEFVRNDVFFIRDIKYVEFYAKLTKILEEKNDDGLWETDAPIEYGAVKDLKFGAVPSTYVAIETKVAGPLTSANHFTVYEYGKNGVYLEIRKVTKKDCIWADEFRTVHMLPACRNGFVRDWNHGGICISKPEGHPVDVDDTRNYHWSDL